MNVAPEVPLDAQGRVRGNSPGTTETALPGVRVGSRFRKGRTDRDGTEAARKGVTREVGWEAWVGPWTVQEREGPTGIRDLCTGLHRRGCDHKKRLSRTVHDQKGR